MTRFMLYNIHRGGAGRLDAIAAAVRGVRPDFLGVLEAIGWGNEQQGTLKRFARDVELPFSHFAKSNTKYDLAFLSRQTPLKVQESREGFWHGVLCVDLRLPTVDPLTLVLLHLNPRREEYRLKELERLRTFIDLSAHTIVMGDFNSLSPHDPYDRAVLLRIFKERGIEKFGREQLQFDCIERVESWGFMDMMQALKKSFIATVPTTSNKDPMHVVPLRLDYVFISPSLKSFLADAAVLHTPETDAASDHYPIVVDFKFAGNK